MRHLYLQPLAVGNIKINYAFQSVSDIIIIVERIGYAPAAFEAIRKGILEADRKGMEQGR